MQLPVELRRSPALRVIERARERPNEVAFVVVTRRGDEGEEITWGALLKQATRIASALPPVSAERPVGVMIMCRQEVHFLPALLAVWLRGAVAIPASGGMTPQIAERNAHILTSARPEIVLHDLVETDLAKLQEAAPQATFHSVSALLQTEESMPVTEARAGGGLLQYTSGTTSAPKAVRLSEAAIAHNCEAIRRTYNLTPDLVGVHWLPLHHDMGLIGSVVTVLWTGGMSVLLRPTVFIQDPLAWAAAMTKWGATITSAPNFAYARLADAASTSDCSEIDLSSLENVIVGGEPVRQETVKTLLQRFATSGLRPDAIAPSYGMAESTLLISSGQKCGGPAYVTTKEGRVVPSLGKAVAGQSLTVWNDGSSCREGEVGRLWASGTSLGAVVPTDQDWRDPRFAAADPFVDTGDFGFVHNGEIFVTGRVANKVIIRGRNIYAEDIEDVASQVVPEIGAGGLAAFAMEGDDTEHLYLVLELPRSATFHHLPELNYAIGRRYGVKLDRVIALRGACLPRTSSGKVRRSEVKRLFLNGAFEKRIVSDVRQSNH